MYWIGPGMPGRSVTKNISGGGICVFMDRRMAPTTRLRIQLDVPGRDAPCQFTGEVVWCEEYPKPVDGGPAVLVGVKFVEIDPSDQEAIMRYCMRRDR